MRVGEAGGTVILVSRTREKLEEVAKQVEEAGGTAHVHPADLSDLDDIERMAQEVIAEHGGVDILINNAGRSIRRSVARSYDRFHDYERTMQLNYFGALKLIMALLPGMRERKSGHIINVSSIGVQTNTPRFSAYVASKSALDAFSRCAAPECVADNVKFTTIYMPLVRTPMIAPTDMYKAFPTLSPEEAAEMLTDAMIDKPKRKASRLGTFGEVLYSLSPATVDIVLNQAYNLFPDSKAAKGKKKKELPSRREDGEVPAAADEEMSTEAVAMAYLLRGVHFIAEAARAALAAPRRPGSRRWSALLERPRVEPRRPGGLRRGGAPPPLQLARGRRDRRRRAAPAGRRGRDAARRGRHPGAEHARAGGRAGRDRAAARRSACGAEPLLLKGPAVARHHPDPALRTFVDLDLLLPRDSLGTGGRRARRRAATSGWWSSTRASGEAHGHDVHVRRKVGIRNLDVELHWRVGDDPLGEALSHELLSADAGAHRRSAGPRGGRAGAAGGAAGAGGAPVQRPRQAADLAGATWSWRRGPRATPTGSRAFELAREHEPAVGAPPRARLRGAPPRLRPRRGRIAAGPPPAWGPLRAVEELDAAASLHVGRLAAMRGRERAAYCGACSSPHARAARHGRATTTPPIWRLVGRHVRATAAAAAAALGAAAALADQTSRPRSRRGRPPVSISSAFGAS